VSQFLKKSFRTRGLKASQGAGGKKNPKSSQKSKRRIALESAGLSHKKKAQRVRMEASAGKRERREKKPAEATGRGS